MSLATPVRDLGQRMVLEGIRWKTYEALLEDLAGQRLRLTYDRGALEIMSPRLDHEKYKTLLGRMVEAMTEELAIPLASAGSTTWKSLAKEKGLESDESYYVQNEPRMRGRLDFDPSEDPPPDLAIEVEITASALDRLGIYAALGVPEIWTYDGRKLSFLVLGRRGEYAAAVSSFAFGFLQPGDLERFLSKFQETDETTWIRGFRRWVREELAGKAKTPPRKKRR